MNTDYSLTFIKNMLPEILKNVETVFLYKETKKSKRGSSFVNF